MSEPTPTGTRREALDNVLIDSLRPVTMILACVFFLFAVVDVFVWRRDGFWFQFGTNLATGATLLAIAITLRSHRPHSAWGHPVAVAIASLVAFRIFLHMFSSPPNYSVPNISLCIMMAGCFVLSNRWLSLLVTAALGGWLTVAIQHGFPTSYAGGVYALAGATCLSYLVMNVRINSYLKFHELRLQDARLRQQLADALELIKVREEWAREMADTAPVMIGTIDEKGRFTYVNQGWLDFVGSVEDDQLGYDWFNCVHPQDSRRWLKTYRRAVKSGGEFKLELRIRRPDGNYRWVLCRARPWRPPHADSDGYIVSAIDIDDRKLAEQQLQESETRLQQILDNTTSVVFMKDLEGRYISVNRRYEELFHVSRTAIQGMTDYDLLPREVARQVRANDQLVVDTGQLLEAEEMVPHDGESRTYISVKFLLRDGSGDPYAVCGIATDITARKTAEEALRQSESRFRRLFEANIIGVLFTDNDGNVTQANDAFLDLMGYAHADLPISWRELSPTHGDEEDELVVERLMRDGIVDPWERDLLRKDGTTVPVLLGGALLDRAKNDCVAFAVDLSERKAADEQIRRLNVELQHATRLSMMGEMTAGLAHEVHQPLGVISNYANGCSLRLEGDGVSNDELQSCMQKISAEAVRAGNILKRIRAFIQKREMQRRPSDLNVIVQEALQLAQLDGRRRQVEIHFEPKPMPRVIVDGIQITQVVLNLVLNAIEAMTEHAGRRELTVAIREQHADKQAVEVTIADTGPGVSPELRDQVFEQFFTTKEGGLGMGLSISRSIIEAHGGRLRLTSNDSGGSTFRFTLPVPTPAESQNVLAAQITSGRS